MGITIVQSKGKRPFVNTKAVEPGDKILLRMESDAPFPPKVFPSKDGKGTFEMFSWTVTVIRINDTEHNVEAYFSPMGGTQIYGKKLVDVMKGKKRGDVLDLTYRVIKTKASKFIGIWEVAGENNPPPMVASVETSPTTSSLPSDDEIVAVLVKKSKDAGKQASPEELDAFFKKLGVTDDAHKKRLSSKYVLELVA